MSRSLVYIPGSPYARKVRIVLSELGVDYEAQLLGTYPPTPAELGAANPTLRIPVFRDGDLELWESDLIADYLFRTYPSQVGGHPPLLPGLVRPDDEWGDRKRLAAIASVTDTLVLVAYLAWCGMAETEENLMGFSLKPRWEGRIASTLDWLEDQATPDGFVPGHFSFMDIALICALDWTDTRLRFPWRGRPNLEALVARFADRPSLTQTAYSVMPDHLAKALERA